MSSQKISTNPEVLSSKLLRSGEKTILESNLAKILRTNDLYPKIETFLYTRHHNDKDTRFFNYYVPNKIDEFLNDFCEMDLNRTEVIVGPRGSGKSASIRYRFGLETSPKIEGDELIIPLFFDNIMDKSPESCKRHIESQFKSAHEKIRKHLKIQQSAADTIEFIRNTKDSLVATFGLDVAVFGEPSDFEIYQKLAEEYPLGMAASELKEALHLADKNGCRIRRTYLIADDLESIIDDETIITTFQTILAAQTCLENMGEYPSPTTLLTLMCLRPATFDILKNTREFNGFNIPHSPRRLQPIEIVKMFRKRLDVNLEGLVDAGEKENWSAAFRIVDNICQSLGHKDSDFFLGMSNYNIRQACDLIRDILDYSYWYEKDNSKSVAAGAIVLNEDDYDFTRASLVRTIALKDSAVYLSRNENGAPNIFHNGSDFTSLLIGPLIIKRCLVDRNSDGFSVCERVKLSNELKLAIPSDTIDQMLPLVLDYFCRYHLLRLVNFGPAQQFVSQPMLFAIWRHLGKSSIFLECYRDDTCVRHYSIASGDVDLAPSSSLQDRVFFGALDFVRSVIEREHVALENVIQNGVLRYKSIFGPSLISSRLFAGAEYSINYFFKSHKNRNSPYRGPSRQYLEIARRELEDLERKWTDCA